VVHAAGPSAGLASTAWRSSPSAARVSVPPASTSSTRTCVRRRSSRRSAVFGAAPCVRRQARRRCASSLSCTPAFACESCSRRNGAVAGCVRKASRSSRRSRVTGVPAPGPTARMRTSAGSPPAAACTSCVQTFANSPVADAVRASVRLACTCSRVPTDVVTPRSSSASVVSHQISSGTASGGSPGSPAACSSASTAAPNHAATRAWNVTPPAVASPPPRRRVADDAEPRRFG
jgi:hypothetical protein